MSGLLERFLGDPDRSRLTVLDIAETPRVRADYESNAPTGLPAMSDVAAWEDILIGYGTQTGQIVTPEKAKRVATVLAIMRGLAEDVSRLPIDVFRRTPNGPEKDRDHEVFTTLCAPNDMMTSMELREHMMFDTMLWGNFFNLKMDDPEDPGVLASLYPLQAGYVIRRWRQMVWDFTDPTTGITGTFLPQDVWRGQILSENGLDGTAITVLCREAIGLLMAAEQQGANLFKRGVQTDFALVAAPGTEIGPQEKDELRRALMARHSGSHNAFMPMILEGGLKPERLGLSAVESQYIEARRFQVEDIARAFRYPEVLLGSGSSGKTSTYASAEQFFMSYTKHTLGPWAVRIEQSADRDLFTTKDRKKYYVKHDFDELLRADQAARYAAWNSAIQGGWMKRSEARRKEGLPYEPGLDGFLQAQNMGEVGDTQNGIPKTAPTDVNGLAFRVARYLVKREERALVTGKESPDVFYAHFGALIEDITGAKPEAVRAYLDMRRATEQRFSIAATEAAVTALAALKGTI